MKNLLYIIIGIGLLFTSCKKDDCIEPIKIPDHIKKDPPIKRPYVDINIHIKNK